LYTFCTGREEGTQRSEVVSECGSWANTATVELKHKLSHSRKINQHYKRVSEYEIGRYD